MPNFNLTSESIIRMFNHSLSYSDRIDIKNLFSMVRNSENVDDLALLVTNTLEEKVARFDNPFCSERQAMALAYVIDGCQ